MILTDEIKIVLIAVFVIIHGCSPGSSDENGDNSQSDRPNIIVMYSDDHTAQAIGAYQNALNYGLELDHTPTPNIDKLAEEGMRFDNAFVTNSICKPSRAVLVTGMHSHKNGVWMNAGAELDTSLVTFPKLLQKSGYETAMVGKWHLGTEPKGFDYYEILHGQGTYYNPKMRTPNGDKTRKGHTTEIVTNSALRWLKQRKGDGPFMMMYNQKAPHRNWVPGPKHLGDYRDRDLPEPSTLFYDYSGLASPAHNQKMEIGDHMTLGWDLKVPKSPENGKPLDGWKSLVNRNNLTDKQLKRIKQAYRAGNQELYDNWGKMSDKEKTQWKYQRYVKDYLRVIRGVDDGVGRLIDYLKQNDLYDNTVVIYAGDQGFFLGENGWFDKRWIYEESMRMPLIVHWPKGIDAGSVNKQLVQNLDLAPTLLDLANVDIPEQMQGESLVPLLKGNKPKDWRDAIYYQYYEGQDHVHHVARHYGIRTQRYTIAHYYKQDAWEMFDLKKDPEQLQSVYGDPEYSDVQKRLKNKIKELQKKYEVEFLPEDKK